MSEEQRLIARLVAPMVTSGLALGPGDDAAVFRPFGDRAPVASCDVMVEGVHFDLSFMSFADVGYRALVAGLSDLAAMGATPEGYLVTLGVPPKTPTEDLKQLYRGLAEAATPWRVPLAGGDVSRSPTRFVDIMVLGSSDGDVLRRDRARPGDLIAVTGAPGLAAQGLEALRTERAADFPQAVRAFLRPVPRFEAAFEAKRCGVQVADDITDGMAEELRAVCEASGVGARLEAARFPPAPGPGDARVAFLSGGDDMELMMTMPPSVFEALRARLKVPLTMVGEVSETPGLVLLEEAGERPLTESGYDHGAER